MDRWHEMKYSFSLSPLSFLHQWMAIGKKLTVPITIGINTIIKSKNENFKKFFIKGHLFS
jgi:hypothetical protein